MPSGLVNWNSSSLDPDPVNPSEELRTHLLPSWSLHKLTHNTLSSLELSLEFNRITASKRLATFWKLEVRPWALGLPLYLILGPVNPEAHAIKSMPNLTQCPFSLHAGSALTMRTPTPGEGQQ